MISLKGISRDYGGTIALKSIDLSIANGEWLGLVGPNGSGKTTMIRIILGLTRPTAGRIYLDGSVPNRQNWLSFKRRIGFMPERIQFYENLTGEETLLYFASIRGISPENIPLLLDEVGLAGDGKRKTGEYSKGMRQRLNLAQALLADPDILILDEPTEGLDPHAVRQFFRLLQGSGDPKKTVLLSSHRLGELENQVDRVCILGDGEIKALGTPRELMGNLKMTVKIHILLPEKASEKPMPALQELGFMVLQEDDRHYTAQVHYGDKSEFIGKLFAKGLRPADLWIEEPDLEEVYFEAH